MGCPVGADGREAGDPGRRDAPSASCRRPRSDDTVRPMVSGLLLTGGASRRLGRDKATLVVHGERFADRGARVLGTVCTPVLEVGPGVSDLPAVREEPAGAGPLAALAAGGAELARRGHDGPTILLGVDLRVRRRPAARAARGLRPVTASSSPSARDGGRRAARGTGVPHSTPRRDLVARGERSLHVAPRGRARRRGGGARVARGRTTARARRPRHARGSRAVRPRGRAVASDAMEERAVRRPTTVTARSRWSTGERMVERPDRLVTEEPMEIRVHGPGQEAAAAGRDDAHARATTSSSPSASASPKGVLASPTTSPRSRYCLAGERRRRSTTSSRCASGSPVDLDELERRFVANARAAASAARRRSTRSRSLRAGRARARSSPGRCSCSCPTLLRDAADGVRRHRRAARRGPLRRPTASSRVAARGRRPPQRARQARSGTRLDDGLLPLADDVLLVSGRLSFEIVQKAAVAGIPIVCAVSAPSSLAVDAAERFGQTVVGFLRDERVQRLHPSRAHRPRAS